MIAVRSHATDQEPSQDGGDVEHDAVVRLRPLLAAAGTDLDDDEAWTVIVGVARQLTVELVARGELPAHLAVGHDDAPVLVARTIAAAWKHVTRSPAPEPRR